ncbi:MAG TPA: Uma2 family endonuclease [Nitrospiraceae bacterium]|jgi:Uma2 family endonuclease|nr:Uma2 family endonuclease [Nitrospiraceae bacterium]
MSTATAHVTAEQFWKLYGDRNRELVAGEVIELSPGSVEHGNITLKAAFPLQTFLQKHPLGELFGNDTGFLLSRNPDTVRGPDVAFVRRERLADLPRDGFFPGAPDLAIEVVSPNDLAQDVERKVQECLTAGAAMVWVLYPDTRHVIVYRPGGEARDLSEKDALDGAEVLPGFACKVEELFGTEPIAKSG